MDALPECAWDAKHGVVVLYRPEAEGARPQGYALAVELDGERTRYFAGDFPADRLIWAVKAPTEGSFKLLFYPLDSPSRLNGQPLIAIPFDDQLRVNHQLLAGRQYRVRGWCLPAEDPIEVPVGTSLTEMLAAGGWEAGARVGLTVTRYGGDAQDSPRGPAIHPLRERGAFIDVRFTYVQDPRTASAQGEDVRVAGFRDLEAPAIVVDLTAFGDLAESLQDGFCFIHRPHGAESAFSRTFGATLPLEVSDDHRLLVWVCDDACHLDHVGVYFSGGSRLRLREAPDITIRGYEGAPGEECLVALFYGRDFLILPTHAEEFAVDGQKPCAPLDMTEVEIQLYAAWVVADEQFHSADWRGAEDAEAFTLTAYADILAQILNAGVTGSGREDLPDLMRRHGVGFRAFAEFARRPDLACALFGHPRLQRLLLRGDRSLTRVLEEDRWLSLSALLAAALEPGAEGLARWIENEPLGVQRALWLFMLAGGKASAWRDLKIPSATADGDLTRLVGLLRLVHEAALPNFPAFIGATLQDLGEDPGILTSPLRSLTDAQDRQAAILRATAAVRGELERANRELSGALPGRQLDPTGCPRGFSAALDAGPVPDVAALRRQVLGSVPLGSAAVNLSAAVLDLRTRVVLWGLQGLLAPHRPPPPPPPPSGVFLTWCLRVLRHTGWEFPPPTGADLADAAEVAAALQECEDFWGLGGADEPQGLPSWTGPRAQEQQRLVALIGQQDAWRYLQHPGADAEVLQVLTRLAPLSDYIAAGTIWNERYERAKALRDSSAGRELWTRIGQSDPDQWDALAAEIDRNSTTGSR